MAFVGLLSSYTVKHSTDTCNSMIKELQSEIKEEGLQPLFLHPSLLVSFPETAGWSLRDENAGLDRLTQQD